MNFYIHKTNHDVFDSLGQMISYEMQSSNEITSDLTKQGIWILFFVSFKDNVHNIIQNSQYIAVQVENLSIWSDELSNDGSTSYSDFLNNALFVWDYTTNFKIGYSKIWNLIYEENKKINFLFYGSLNDRRMDIINKIPSVVYSNNLYGENLWNCIRDTKIVLSINYYNISNNDMVRIAPLISNRIFVICEKTADDEFNNIKDLVIVDYEKIPEAAEYYLHNPMKRIDYINRAYEYIKQHPIQIPRI